MRWGLGSRIFLLAVLGPVLTTTVLVGYLFHSRGQDIQAQTLERGESVARQLAPALTEPLARGEHQLLAHVIDAARVDPVIARVTLQRPDGSVLLERGLSGAAHQGPLVRVGSWMLGLHRAPDFRVPVLPAPAPVLDPLLIQQGVTPLGWVRVEVDASPYLHREAGMVLQAAAVLGLVTMISLLLGYWARRTVTRPVDTLTETVRRLGAGDLRARVQLLAGGEVGTLARAINRMAIRQERNEKDLNDQIEQATRELRETLEAVEIQNAELDIARKRALEGSKVKSEFLANMSHEIRTPINGILGFADLLSHSRLDEEQQDYVGTIRESCTNLLALVNDILDFSKIEAGKLVIDNVAFDMRDCIEEVLSLMAPTAYGKSLELVQIIYQDVPVRLFGDPIRIRQVLTNLVHNAIKFTPEGRVVVRVMLDADDNDRERARIRVAVSDSGIGMKPDEQQRLFQAFSQADTSITRRFGGAGLGLIISKKLAEQMGGEIGLDSEPQVGSTFWFTLDCLKQRRVEPEDSVGTQSSPLAGRRILLHDTSTLSRLAVRHVIEGWGAHVHEVEDTAAMQTRGLLSEQWDAVLIGLSRDELNRRYFRDIFPAARAIGAPVLVLASTVDRNELRSLYQQGAHSSLPKAVRRQTLYRELYRVLDGGAPARERLQEAPAPLVPAATASKQDTDYDDCPVLVVDDNAINRKLVSTILRRHGVPVTEGEDGRQAVDLCDRNEFVLVFLDIHMPNLSGEAAYQAICNNLRARDAPMPRVVALTANALGGERERLLHLGMNECLIKPVTETQIMRQVRAIAERSTDNAGQTEPDGTAHRALGGQLQAMLADELPDHRRRIRQAYRRGELEKLRDQVHTLNGAASVCGADELQQACAGLEQVVVGNRRVDIPARVERVVAAINALLASQPQDH